MQKCWDREESNQATRLSLVAQLVKNPPAVQETKLPSLGGENPLEKEMATHSSILTWRIPWTEQPGGHITYGFLSFSFLVCQLLLYIF